MNKNKSKYKSKSITYPSITGLTQYVGVDTLTVYIPLHEDSNDGSSPLLKKTGVRTSTKGQPLIWVRGSFEPEGVSTLGFEIFDSGRRLKLTLHPSKILDNKNSTLCSGDSVAATVYWAITQLYGLCRPIWTIDENTQEILDEEIQWPENWRELITVSRLDLARDFKVTDESFGIANLLNLKIGGHNKDIIYRNSHQMNTLCYGNGNRLRTNFYNKFAAPNHNVPPGWFRFETQIKRTFLKTAGIITLDDISQKRVEEILWKRWDSSNLWTPMTLNSELSSFYNSIVEGESANAAITFMGLATVMSSGLPVGINPRTISHYRKIGAKYGFQLGNSLDSMGTSLSSLDFVSGVLVDVSGIGKVAGSSCIQTSVFASQ